MGERRRVGEMRKMLEEMIWVFQMFCKVLVPTFLDLHIPTKLLSVVDFPQNIPMLPLCHENIASELGMNVLLGGRWRKIEWDG